MIERSSTKELSVLICKMERCLELDVAIVGGGPSGIAAAYYMAKAGLKSGALRPQAIAWWWYVGRCYDVQPAGYTARSPTYN